LPNEGLRERHVARDFLKDNGRLAGASALAGIALPHAHAAESNTIQPALVGCGNRGTGATVNALGIKNRPIKLVAMADVFPQNVGILWVSRRYCDSVQLARLRADRRTVRQFFRE
jgi:hypothetical protein